MYITQVHVFEGLVACTVRGYTSLVTYMQHAGTPLCRTYIMHISTRVHLFEGLMHR